MKDRNIHVLDFDKTKSHFVCYLKPGHTLSCKILELIDFKKGSFFTCLTNKALIERAHYFEYGGIMPEISSNQIAYTSDGKPFVVKHVLTMREDLEKFIFDYLNENNKNIAVCEAVKLRKTDRNLRLDNIKIGFKNEEVYYILNHNNTLENIERAVGKTDALWHFLIVLSESASNFEEQLSDSDFDNICKNVNYVIIGAYDGEAYLFWKKKE